MEIFVFLVFWENFLKAPSATTGSWSPVYGHPLDMDTSLIRTVFMLPRVESPYIFSKFNLLLKHGHPLIQTTDNGQPGEYSLT